MLPFAVALGLFQNRGRAQRQTAVVALASLVTLGITATYSAVLGRGSGDTWLGIVVVCLAPYALVLGALQLPILRGRPVLVFVFAPLVYFLGLFAIVVLAVNAGLVGPPF